MFTFCYDGDKGTALGYFLTVEDFFLFFGNRFAEVTLLLSPTTWIQGTLSTDPVLDINCGSSLGTMFFLTLPFGAPLKFFIVCERLTN